MIKGLSSMKVKIDCTYQKTFLCLANVILHQSARLLSSTILDFLKNNYKDLIFKLQVLAYSREDNHVIAKCLGAKFYYDMNEMLSAQPDIVLIATSIISTELVIN